MRRILAVCVAAALLEGCETAPVATDVQVVPKPLPTVCTFVWPPRPTPHVSNVQLTGNLLVDLVLIWRAAEAELEERIAYEEKLEAAAKKCIEGGPAPPV